MKIKGYLTLYFKVKITNEPQVAYGTLNCDFDKPIDEEFFKVVADNITQVYNESGYEVDSIEFCDRKEYEADKSSVMCKYEWEDK